MHALYLVLAFSRTTIFWWAKMKKNWNCMLNFKSSTKKDEKYLFKLLNVGFDSTNAYTVLKDIMKCNMFHPSKTSLQSTSALCTWYEMKSIHRKDACCVKQGGKHKQQKTTLHLMPTRWTTHQYIDLSGRELIILFLFDLQDFIQTHIALQSYTGS